MSTLALDPLTWDLMTDSAGNISVKTGIDAILQDVCSAVRLFLGELWYDVSQGIPYFGQILGKIPPSQLVQSQIERAALTVPGVTRVTCTFKSFTARTLNGTIHVAAGDLTGAITFGASPGSGVPWYVQAISISTYTPPG